jgi:RNA polymerase sigma-70 factor (ECF subfamily)
MEEKPPVQQPYGQSDDAELLRRSYAGDPSAFEALVERHARYLTGIALGLCDRNLADAEDVVQETFVAALTSRFRGESSAKTWLVQILVRRAALLRRTRKHEPRRSAAGGEVERTSRSDSPGVDSKLDLAEMLAGLPPDQRQVIVLRELEGLSYEEMARTLHVPRGTVESRLHRARVALKELFRGYF